MWRNSFSKTRELVVFAMLGALMFSSKIILEFLPNIHMLALFTIVFTVVYGARGLIPIYIYAAILTVYYGFQPWLLIHYYVWLVLWCITMPIPVNMNKKIAVPVYVALGAFHGVVYGFLCALTQVPIYYNTFSVVTVLAYTATGIKWDLIQAAGNAAMCTLAVPLIILLDKLSRKMGIKTRLHD